MLCRQFVVEDKSLGDEVVRGTTVDESGGPTAGEGDRDVNELSTEVSTEVGGRL